jgi:hypothetical protein
MELPFAGLQQLCISMLDHLDHLPPPQSDALPTASACETGRSLIASSSAWPS